MTLHEIGALTLVIMFFMGIFPSLIRLVYYLLLAASVAAILFVVIFIPLSIVFLK